MSDSDLDLISVLCFVLLFPIEIFGQEFEKFELMSLFTFCFFADLLFNARSELIFKNCHMYVKLCSLNKWNLLSLH